MIKSNNKETTIQRNNKITRIGFYQRARYSYAIVVKNNKDNTREFFTFQRGKLNNKWLKKVLKTPHFDIDKMKAVDKFWLEDSNKRDMYLEVYFFKYSPEAHDKLMGLIAIDRLDQTVQLLDEWINESLNVDCKLREKVKALLDTIDSYKADYEIVR